MNSTAVHATRSKKKNPPPAFRYIGEITRAEERALLAAKGLPRKRLAADAPFNVGYHVKD